MTFKASKLRVIGDEVVVSDEGREATLDEVVKAMLKRAGVRLHPGSDRVFLRELRQNGDVLAEPLVPWPKAVR